MSAITTVFPAELLEHLVSWVDECADLLSLALTCRVFSRIIIPRHIEYRTIKCRLRSPIWTHLKERGDLARNVRTLQIIDSIQPFRFLGSEILPKTFFDDEIDVASSQLIWGDVGPQLHVALKNMTDAVANMEGLQTFRWPEGSTAFVDQTFWNTLAYRTSLTKLTIGALNSFDPTPFSDLRSLRISNMQWDVSQLHNFMLNAPNLENIHIRVRHKIDLDGSNFIFPDGHWARLRNLSVTIRGHSTSACRTSRRFARFLEDHPTLEEVSWFDFVPDKLADGSLPVLEQLAGRDHLNGISNIISSPVPTPRPIKGLGSFRLTPDYRATLAYVDLGSLENLQLKYFESLEHLIALVALLPKLCWLQVPSDNYESGQTASTTYPINKDDWRNFLSQTPRLEVFHGVSFFTGKGISDEETEIARDIAYRCPNLRRIDHWDEDIRKSMCKVVELVRSQEGVVTFKEVKWG